MKKIVFFVLLISLLSCHTAKYTYTFDHNHLDFNQGKWVLSEIYGESSYSRLNDQAFREFKEIIDDSLFHLYEVRNKGVGIMSAKVPFVLSANELKKFNTPQILII